MPRPITISIDVTKIDKAHIYQGKKGKYLNLAAWPNKNGEGQYGDTHYVVQEVSKEAREQGVKGAIIGNAKVPQEAPPQRQQRPPQRPAPRQEGEDYSYQAGMEDEDIPF